MSDNQDESQKTEEPTTRKLTEARQKGNVIPSMEVSNLAILFGGALTAAFLGPFMAERLMRATGGLLANVHAITFDAENVGDALLEVLFEVALAMAPVVGLLLVLAVGSKLVVNGFLLSGESLKPSLDRISPIKGLQRLFSLKSIVEFLKGLVKLSIVGTIVLTITLPVIDRVEILMQMDIAATAEETRWVIVKMFAGVVGIMVLIAGLDHLYQRHEYMKQMRMTKQEVRDEHKQSEGDPLVKGRLRQIRAERARTRMMAAVPTADVVVTNPTHFAVALKYDMESMSAPRVVAKGVDEVAFRIRDVANENDVPIVENPPLARALFDVADVDEEIPPEHYKAVAEVISYVFQLKKKPLE
ncbi:MAG: flagellar biosynthesis protein FlhB [Rhodospirillaceae bacterium]|nr:flagellar biosynthesis protein FlhB [Rhodospirillaceae bacterium]